MDLIPPLAGPQAPSAGRVAAFADAEGALRAAHALLDAGVPAARLGFVGADDGAFGAALAALRFPVHPVHELPQALAHAVGTAGHEAWFGAGLGAAAGLAVGLGPFAIPLFGPWLVTAAAVEIVGGAAVAAALGTGVGALFGKLYEHDVETRHVARWTTALRAGGWLLVAHGDAAELARFDAVLAGQAGAHVDVLAA